MSKLINLTFLKCKTSFSCGEMYGALTDIKIVVVVWLHKASNESTLTAMLEPSQNRMLLMCKRAFPLLSSLLLQRTLQRSTGAHVQFAEFTFRSKRFSKLKQRAVTDFLFSINK